MKFLTLDDIHAHTRVSHDAENEILVAKATAAEEFILDYLDRTYDELIDEYGEVPAPVVQAALMVTEDLYEHPSNSEAVSVNPTAIGFDMLIKKYMKLV